MPMPMPPQAAPQGAPQAGPQPGQGNASKLVVQINDGLMQLMDLMSGAKGLPDEDKQELAQIISAFKSFVENLGKPPGQEPQDKGAPEPSGPVPMEAGAGKPMMAM